MSLFDGVDLSDEQKEKLQANIDSHNAENFVSKSEFEAVESKKNELLGEKKAEQQKRREAEEAAEAARLAKAEKDGDVEAINRSWKEKFDKVNGELEGLKASDKKSKINAIADQFINSKVVDDPLIRDAMRQKLTSRLDLRDGKPVVLNKDGELTVSSTDELFSEFESDEQNKPHLVANRASGGGAGGSGNGNGAGGAKKSLTEIPVGDKEGRIAAIAARRQSQS